MTVIDAARAVTSRSRLDPALVASTIAAVLFLAAAAVPGVLAPYPPTALALDSALEAPSLAHPFGTDQIGRDLLSRVVFGTRESLLIGFGAAGIALVAAIVLGSLAALGGRIVSAVVGRLIEVVFAFPILLLALLLVSILGPSAWTQVVAVGVSTAPGYARMVRGQILSAKNAGYVEAARALGHGPWRILCNHVLPNAIRPLVAVFAMALGQSIVWASGLSFLGLGVAPPSSEWGALLDAGRAFILQAPWLTFIPGLIIVVFALAVTTIGTRIQRSLEKGE